MGNWVPLLATYVYIVFQNWRLFFCSQLYMRLGASDSVGERKKEKKKGGKKEKKKERRKGRMKENNKPSMDRTWSAVPDALLGVIS